MFKGSGRTAVGEGFLEWKQGDSFVIPLWQWHAHENTSEDEAILFSINDRPINHFDSSFVAVASLSTR